MPLEGQVSLPVSFQTRIFLFAYTPQMWSPKVSLLAKNKVLKEWLVITPKH